MFETQLDVGLNRLCPKCREIELLVAPDPDEWAGAGHGHGEEWREADELEQPRKWAARVWRHWSPADRAEVAGALMSLRDVLRGAGDGENARHRRRRAA